MTNIDTSTRLEQINIRVEGTNRKCEWVNCDEVATAWLVCPVCNSKELQCSFHSNVVRNAPVGVLVTFNVTCQHIVQQISCGIEPL